MGVRNPPNGKYIPATAYKGIICAIKVTKLKKRRLEQPSHACMRGANALEKMAKRKTKRPILMTPETPILRTDEACRTVVYVKVWIPGISGFVEHTYHLKGRSKPVER
jgi:hypothetical protein